MELEKLRAFCLSLPGATEDVKWGHDLCFSVGAKMFCVASMEPPLTFSFKVTDDAYDELAASPGFEPAPYMARNKWVLVNDPMKVKPKEVEKLIRESHELVAAKLPKKLRASLGLD
jgi:predicted DNA-binding protein (MmcQ/YjbR family)